LKTVHITLHDGSRIINETISRDMNLMEALHHVHEVTLDAPCGGKGTCGKCRIRVREGDVSPVTPEEEKLLSAEDLSRGIRLACKTKVNGPAVIELEKTVGAARIQTEGKAYSGPVDPVIGKHTVTLPAPDLEDQRSDEERLLAALPEGTVMGHSLRQSLPSLLRQGEYTVTAVLCGKEVTALEPGNSSSPLHALAVDIGTTTVVAYLLDLESGKTLGTASGLNRQKSFGGDVISRIDYVGEDPDKRKKLQDRITGQIRQLLTDLLEEASLEETDLHGIFLAGNTTMMHLLAGLDPRTLAAAPFIPVSTERMILTPSEIGLSLPDHIRMILLPSLSAYIGADIVAGILSTGMAESEDLCLLVDIGTNGEIALGNRERIITCSTAAGPAFEGANIQCGTGGVPGAISCVDGEDGTIEWKTIHDLPAAGICGSGIIDMTSYLLRTGIADYTGRFQDESDWGDTPPENAGFLEPDGDSVRFILTRDPSDIYFSQKDLREVQLAKGSIAAGIKTLISESGRELSDVKHVYLAGGFGSFIDKKSALAIGLIPEELGDRIQSVGNSSGAGVIRAALNRADLDAADRIRARAEYLELSSHKGFQDEYILNMYFPETES